MIASEYCVDGLVASGDCARSRVDVMGMERTRARRRDDRKDEEEKNKSQKVVCMNENFFA